MTETTKVIFEKYQVRKSKKQKTAFIDYVKQVAASYGYDLKVEKGSFGARNIVIGNADTAKVLYTAHYDTCPRLPFPNFITPKNFLFYLLYQILIIAVFLVLFFLLMVALVFLISRLPLAEDTVYTLTIFLPQILWIAMVFLMMGGPANKR